jgi:hypothetical protein
MTALGGRRPRPPAGRLAVLLLLAAWAAQTAAGAAGAPAAGAPRARATAFVCSSGAPPPPPRLPPGAACAGFVAAFKNASIGTIVLLQDVSLQPHDWHADGCGPCAGDRAPQIPRAAAAAAAAARPPAARARTRRPALPRAGARRRARSRFAPRGPRLNPGRPPAALTSIPTPWTATSWSPPTPWRPSSTSTTSQVGWGGVGWGGGGSGGECWARRGTAGQGLRSGWGGQDGALACQGLFGAGRWLPLSSRHAPARRHNWSAPRTSLSPDPPEHPLRADGVLLGPNVTITFANMSLENLRWGRGRGGGGTRRGEAQGQRARGMPAGLGCLEALG